MLIKLNIDGELLKLLKADAEENCRSNPQQILYYLKQIYKGKSIEPKVIQQVHEQESKEQENIQSGVIVDNISTDKVLSDTNIGTEVVQEQSKEDYDYIDDDMIDF